MTSGSNAESGFSQDRPPDPAAPGPAYGEPDLRGGDGPPPGPGGGGLDPAELAGQMLDRVTMLGELTLTLDGDAVRLIADHREIELAADGFASLRRLIQALIQLKPDGGSSARAPDAGTVDPSDAPPAAVRRTARLDFQSFALKAFSGVAKIKRYRGRINAVADRLEASGYTLRVRVETQVVMQMGRGVEPNRALRAAGLRHVNAESLNVLQSLFT